MGRGAALMLSLIDRRRNDHVNVFAGYTNHDAGAAGAGGLTIYNPAGSGVNAIVRRVRNSSDNTGGFENCYFGFATNQPGNGSLNEVTPVRLGPGDDPKCTLGYFDAEANDTPFHTSTKRIYIQPDWPRQQIPGVIVTPGNYFWALTDTFDIWVRINFIWQEVKR